MDNIAQNASGDEIQLSNELKAVFVCDRKVSWVHFTSLI